MNTGIVHLIIALCQESHITSGSSGTSGATWIDKRCVSDIASTDPKTPMAVTERYETIQSCWGMSDSMGGREIEKYKKCLKTTKVKGKK